MAALGSRQVELGADDREPRCGRRRPRPGCSPGAPTGRPRSPPWRQRHVPRPAPARSSAARLSRCTPHGAGLKAQFPTCESDPPAITSPPKPKGWDGGGRSLKELREELSSKELRGEASTREVERGHEVE